MDENEFNEHLAKLNVGAAIIDAAHREIDKMPGAKIVSEVGDILVKSGGKDLLQKAHGLALPEHQRTIELQWFGLTDAAGRQWLP